MVSKNFDLNEMAHIQERIKTGRLELGEPWKILLGLPDSTRRIIYTWCSNKMRNRKPEVTFKWIKNKGYGDEEAWAITEMLYRGFDEPEGGWKLKKPEIKEEPKPSVPQPDLKKSTPPPPKIKKKPGRKPIKLTPGQIEYLHQRHREYRNRTGKDPPHLTVRAWLQDTTKYNRSICDRLAMDYLEKYKPKEYK